jgi:hypothetical protein
VRNSEGLNSSNPIMTEENLHIHVKNRNHTHINTQIHTQN